ncbi:MAG: hypothetical protein JO083_06355 [Candidatus Eremiobacteraeota bacterium]|nr:hypothetical protein [Candidatus Eremiobacteraeota bacterium]
MDCVLAVGVALICLVPLLTIGGGTPTLLEICRTAVNFIGPSVFEAAALLVGEQQIRRYRQNSAKDG